MYEYINTYTQSTTYLLTDSTKLCFELPYMIFFGALESSFVGLSLDSSNSIFQHDRGSP